MSGWIGDFFRVAWLVMRKDLTVEMRSREILYTTAFFAASCILVFAFGFVKQGRPVDDVSAGILWIAVAFAGTLALGRTFERERTNETLQALMLAPGDRPAVYLEVGTNDEADAVSYPDVDMHYDPAVQGGEFTRKDGTPY